MKTTPSKTVYHDCRLHWWIDSQKCWCSESSADATQVINQYLYVRPRTVVVPPELSVNFLEEPFSEYDGRVGGVFDLDALRESTVFCPLPRPLELVTCECGYREHDDIEQAVFVASLQSEIIWTFSDAMLKYYLLNQSLDTEDTGEVELHFLRYHYHQALSLMHAQIGRAHKLLPVQEIAPRIQYVGAWLGRWRLD